VDEVEGDVDSEDEFELVDEDGDEVAELND